jgi:hypothetical protein
MAEQAALASRKDEPIKDAYDPADQDTANDTA